MTLSVAGWKGTAGFSPCGTYRYELSREWPNGDGTCLFLMLNPSTASAEENDPTIRRCCGFARHWGYRRLEIRNIFAYRATDPELMIVAKRSGVDIIGPENDDAIGRAAAGAQRVIVAWGAHGLAVDRGRDVMRMFGTRPVFCLGTSRSGAPRHPLYVPGNWVPFEYRGT